jgi:hypothetical protein
MTELMRILLDADTLLEFLLNRSKFIGKVEYLSEIFGANSSIQLYLSKPGLDKIVSLQALNEKESEQLVTRLKKRIKILRVTKAVAKKARSSSAIDYESAVEIHLAIKANIGAIVTHKPSDFSSEELKIISLNDLQQRKHLEDILSKNIKDLPAVFVINSEQISNLEAFYHLPSYTGVKSLEPKESSHQLDLTCSSDKVFSPSDDELLPRSRYARSIAYADAAKLRSLGLENLTCKTSIDTLKVSIDRDRLSIKLFARSTAQVDIQSSELITRCRAYTDPVISLKESKLHASKAYSLLVDELSIKPLLARPTAYANMQNISDLSTACQPYISLLDSAQESIRQYSKIWSSAINSTSIKSPDRQSIGKLKSMRICGLTATALQPYENSLGSKLMKDLLPSGKGWSLAVDSLSIKPPALQSIRQIESTKISDIADTALQPHKNSLGGQLMKDLLPSGKGWSLAVDSLSIRSPALQPIRQIESSRFGGIVATSLQAPETLLDTWKERMDRASQLNPLLEVHHSFSDRSGLLSQIKSIESMQKANTLESYLSRKN